MRGLTTAFSGNTAYGYFGCANDHMATGYDAERFWSAFDVARNPSHVVMNCWGGGAAVSAVRPSNGLHANPEELFWGSWLESFAADPSLTAEGAGCIWREVTRSHNSGEGGSTNNAAAYARCAPSVPLSSGWQYDRNTMPNVVGACVRGVVSEGMSACASMRCKTGSYAFPIALPGGGPAECRCLEDPAGWGDPQVVFYDRPTGYAQVGTIPVDPYWTYQAGAHLAPGFAHAVGLTGGRRFFYNAANGTASVVRVLSNGNLAVLSNLSGFSWGWEQIISLPNGLIVFYDNTGLVAWGEIDESQAFRQGGYTWGALGGATSIAAGGYDPTSSKPQPSSPQQRVRHGPRAVRGDRRPSGPSSAGMRAPTATTADLLARARRCFPALVGATHLATSVKCTLFSATLDGAPVVVKALRRDVPPWRWYFAREVALLHGAPRAALPVAGPRLLAADLAAGVAVLTRVDGDPLARGRFVPGCLPRSTLDALVDGALALARWTDGVALASCAPPPSPEDTLAVRERLLEDPTQATRGCAETLARAAAAGALPAALAARATEALPMAMDFAHGDLLPRNVLARDGAIAFVDWECAGRYARGWDLAQLWTALPAAQRPAVVEAAGALGLCREAFEAVAAVALARERFYRARFAEAGDARWAALDEALAALLRG